MVSLLKPEKNAFETAQRLCVDAFGINLLKLAGQDLINNLDLESPFFLDENYHPLEHVNSYFRQRCQGRLFQYSSTKLSETSSATYGYHIRDALLTFRNPSIEAIWKNGKTLFEMYERHLKKTDNSYETNSIRLRLFKELLEFLGSLSQEEINTFSRTKVRASLPNHANKRINQEQTLGAFGRRRHPRELFILHPNELVAFFNSFTHKTLALCPKIIYSTGLRRAELCGLTCGAIARMKPYAPGRAAPLQIVGKGRVRRKLEVEPATQRIIQRYLVSDERLERAELYSKKHGSSPFDDRAPFLLNRFGEPITPAALTDAFSRASARCQIKRTPHELRHEFAVSYLLISYRKLNAKISRDGFDAFIARLIKSETDMTVIKLSKLLGHASPETTKKHYLHMLVTADAELRHAWCDHLEEMEGDL